MLKVILWASGGIILLCLQLVVVSMIIDPGPKVGEHYMFIVVDALMTDGNPFREPVSVRRQQTQCAEVLDIREGWIQFEIFTPLRDKGYVIERPLEFFTTVYDTKVDECN